MAVVDGEKALEIAKKHLKPLLVEELELVLIPALEKVVADSPNKYDDMLVALLKDALLEAVKEQIGNI